MRKSILGLALASSALATPALARDNAWYLELDAGATIAENINVRAIPGGALGGTLDTDVGYDFGGIVGYDFGSFRLEAEGAYKRVTNKSFVAPVGNSLGIIAGTYSGLDGHVDALSFMLNGLVDFGPDDGLQGFVGGGVGVARVGAQQAALVNDSDSGFAWQLLAGLRLPLSEHVDLGLKYRFFNVDNVDLVSTGPTNTRSRYRSHSALVTLAYNFGEEAAPPPPPPPPPPPVVECNKGPYIVFFDWDKSDITPEAGSILDSAVQAYGNCGTVPIMLAGYADRSGSATYNVGLSARRNASVRGYLTSRGIADGAITSQAFGETNPRVPTADGVRELQNRRVEITYGPGSGN